MKNCTKCKIERPFSDFPVSKKSKDGRDSWCKICVNEAVWKLRGVEGFTVKAFEELNELQNGLCAICNKTCSSGKRLSADHDHETKIVRGLPCQRCNAGIGFPDDDKDLVFAAYKYLCMR